MEDYRLFIIVTDNKFQIIKSWASKLFIVHKGCLHIGYWVFVKGINIIKLIMVKKIHLSL